MENNNTESNGKIELKALEFARENLDLYEKGITEENFGNNTERIQEILENLRGIFEMCKLETYDENREAEFTYENEKAHHQIRIFSYKNIDSSEILGLEIKWDISSRRASEKEFSKQMSLAYTKKGVLNGTTELKNYICRYANQEGSNRGQFGYIGKGEELEEVLHKGKIIKDLNFDGFTRG